MDTIISILMDANTQWVIMGTFLLGLSSGILGSFALLKKQSLIGDAVAHAALPGICIAYLIYGSKSMLWFMVGAIVIGLLATYLIQLIVSHSRIKEDTSIGLVLSVFFGFGIVLLTYINQHARGNQSGLNDFIFGQAASLVGNDVKTISWISFILIFITALIFKELKLLTFDPQFAKGIGLPTGVLNILLMTLIVGSVVVGLQAVGVILMAAMLITPAIAARYWTERLDRMVIIAGAIGAFSGVVGTLLSTVSRGMPTGPLIIMAATFIFLISLLFAPERGLLPKVFRHYQLKKVTAYEQLLQTIYDVTEEQLLKQKIINSKTVHLHDLLKRRPFSKRRLKALIKHLKRGNLIYLDQDELITFTEKGLQTAHEITLKHRLYEMFLINESMFSPSDAELAKENILDVDKKVLQVLEEYLKEYGRQPMAVDLWKDDFNEEIKPKINHLRHVSKRSVNRT